MRLEARARWFCTVANLHELNEALAFAKTRRVKPLILGEGSNTLLFGDVETLVIQNKIMGSTLDASGLLDVGGGENWHGQVQNTVSKGWFGLENLALIPGTAGAAPMQNIGAYGAELADVCESVQALNLSSGELCELDKDACRFSYRQSRFKEESDWFVTRVRLVLHRSLNQSIIHYPGIEEYIAKNELPTDSTSIFKAVCHLRRSKLPDPSVLPNAGSFFKNPEVSEEKARMLQQRYSDMPVFPKRSENASGAKLSAGWLIEELGMKGFQIGGFMVSRQHALVIVNAGAGVSEELAELRDEVIKRVFNEFGVALEVEPRSYP